jgi:5-methylcytosine-specific restriction endonuclease McrA
MAAKPGRRDHRSTEAKSYRHLYNNSRWKGPHGRRAEQLQREPLCRMCAAAGRVTPATVADHVIPHRGNETLFWEGELQSLCAPHHDATKQRIEARGYEHGCDEQGWPIDQRRAWRLGGKR